MKRWYIAVEVDLYDYAMVVEEVAWEADYDMG